ncbi:Uncharacterised protein [Mycobacteroides abscessus subsp. abscessus]|nr:Uncharacterised protein [Mycobacteroides abscessus subsp. abscessus]
MSMPVVASAKCCCHMVMGSWVRLAYRVAVNGPPADAVATALAVEGGYWLGHRSCGVQSSTSLALWALCSRIL